MTKLLTPPVLKTHLVHSPVLGSQLPTAFSSVLPLQSHFLHGLLSLGSPKKPSIQCSQRAPKIDLKS